MLSARPSPVIVITLILVIPLDLARTAPAKGHLKYQVESAFRNEIMRERFELLDQIQAGEWLLDSSDIAGFRGSHS
jgi:hypothetical protein